MDRIVVDIMRDTIIVEKSNGNVVEKGSRFFCGCCGRTLGESKKKLVIPFSKKKFYESLKNKSFDMMLFGLYHKTCGHTMFSFKKGYGFIPMEVYIENVPQPQQL